MKTIQKKNHSNDKSWAFSLFEIVQRLYVLVFPVYQPEKYQLRYAPIRSRITTLAATAPKTAGR
jgi:hypothetical protein